MFKHIYLLIFDLIIAISISCSNTPNNYRHQFKGTGVSNQSQK